MRNVFCFKWGTAYGPEYVNRLYRGVKTHLEGEFRFVCSTDNPSGLEKEIDIVPLPARPENIHDWNDYKGWPTAYIKLCVFEKGFAGLEGPTLFLDIDQIVTGNLECFFDYHPGEFCIIRNWVEWRKRIFRRVPFCGNSSCFRFEAGAASDWIYRQFLADLANDTAMDSRLYTTEQAYMTHVLGCARINFWPDYFVRSFKRSCAWPWPLNHFLTPRLPDDTRILCFHGRPSPEQAIVGYRGRHLNTWTKPCAWVKELWYA